MLVMTLISVLLVVSVVGTAIWKEKALPESISSLVFVFRHKWLWTVWIWAVSLLTLIPVIDKLSRFGMEALGFGSLVCLMFCGAMPLIDKENTVGHWVSGTSGCILSQGCVWFLGRQWLPVWILFVFLFLSSYIQPGGWLGRAMKGKGVLLAEMTCYICLVAASC